MLDSSLMTTFKMTVRVNCAVSECIPLSESIKAFVMCSVISDYFQTHRL